MSEPDPLIRQLREQISDNDRTIVEAINARLRARRAAEGLQGVARACRSSTRSARNGCSSTSRARTAGRFRRTGCRSCSTEILGLTKREVERGGSG